MKTSTAVGDKQQPRMLRESHTRQKGATLWSQPHRLSTQTCAYNVYTKVAHTSILGGIKGLENKEADLRRTQVSQKNWLNHICCFGFLCSDFRV